MTTMDIGPCVEWTGYRQKFGYGVRSINGRKAVLAHRYAWEVANGPIPKGMVVMHLCDNPPCVRIEHLRVGTQAENLRDMAMKGRAVGGLLKGSQIGTSKLTEAQVAEIRGLLALGLRHKAIAVRFGVSRDTVTLINRGKTWRHVKAA